jgi:hypothetical protein
MHPALKLVIDRFSSVSEEAVLLFEQDDAFRELCEEYLICCEAAGRMERPERARAALRKEYVALRLRLEGELLRYLSEHPDA